MNTSIAYALKRVDLTIDTKDRGHTYFKHNQPFTDTGDCRRRDIVKTYE
ncbi:MAG: hypothetical protein IH627_12225 [Rubrivivax sp.]|nr:hypothetical protein [Rubrivivax sp.]